MKAFIVLLLALGMSASAQPMFTIVSPGSLTNIIWADCVNAATPWPVGNPSGLKIAVYGAPAGTELRTISGIPDFPGSGWQMMTSPVITNIGPVPGSFTPKQVVMPESLGPVGTAIQCIVVGWSGDYPTFTSAAYSTMVGWVGRLRFGAGPLGWLQPTATPTRPEVLSLREPLFISPLSWIAAAPTGLRAEAGAGVVNLEWNSSLGASGYQLQRAANEGAFETILGWVGGTNYADVKVAEGTRYSYRVGALSFGCTMQAAFSEPVTATAKAAPKLSGRFSDGEKTFVVSWADSAANYTPHSTTNLLTGSWEAVTNAPVVSGGTLQITLPVSNAPARFYRLRLP